MNFEIACKLLKAEQQFYLWAQMEHRLLSRDIDDTFHHFTFGKYNNKCQRGK